MRRCHETRDTAELALGCIFFPRRFRKPLCFTPYYTEYHEVPRSVVRIRRCKHLSVTLHFLSQRRQANETKYLKIQSFLEEVGGESINRMSFPWI